MNHFTADTSKSSKYQPYSMKVMQPRSAVGFKTNDINGNVVHLSSLRGQGVVLCFFRDTTRPSRNKRIFELTRRYKEWKEMGIEIIVVFNENKTTLRKFFEARPRPFPVIADPALVLYKLYGVKRVIGKDLIAPSLESPSWLNKLFNGRLAWLNPTGRIMPADFLINPQGKITSHWHGKSENDHIPFDRLETFAIATHVFLSRKAKIIN